MTSIKTNQLNNKRQCSGKFPKMVPLARKWLRNTGMKACDKRKVQFMPTKHYYIFNTYKPMANLDKEEWGSLQASADNPALQFKIHKQTLKRSTQKVS